MDHVTRRNALAERCADLEVDALLVSKLANVRYLTGFTGSSGMALVGPAGSVFFTDGRYDEQSRHEVPDLDRVASMEDPAVAIREHARRLGVQRLGFERHATTVAQFERWQERLDGLQLAGVGEEVERLRWAKDPEELAQLRAAQEATDGAFEDILEVLVVGITERQAAAQLDAFHESFNFCIDCRQYTCGNCWNEAEGRCLSCAPHLGREVLPAPFGKYFLTEKLATGGMAEIYLGKLLGNLLTTDHFGNLITNIDASLIRSFANPVVRTGGRTFPLRRTYGDVVPSPWADRRILVTK